MNILLVFDNNFNINKNKLSSFFEKESLEEIKIDIYEENIQIKDRFISELSSFHQVNNIIQIKNYDKVIVFSDKQYVDNYFFHTYENIVICSFYGWRYFTNLSKSNGILYFIIDILALELDSSFRHYETTACIYDFLTDKTGIDEGMRHANFCYDCKNRLNNSLSKNKKNIFKELKILMEKLSNTSKKEQDILQNVNRESFSASDINITNETILISNLIKRLEKNKIKLDRENKPWDTIQMSRFIESILLRLPLPALYFDVSSPKNWEVIDGIKRLKTLKQFIIDKEFSLIDLEFLTKLNGKKYIDLEGSLKRVIDETAIITYQVEIQTPKRIRDSIVKRINNKREKNENK